MTAGIRLTQNGTVYNSAGASHPAPISIAGNELCYLSFVGAPVPTVFAWAISSVADPRAVISSSLSHGPTFFPLPGADYAISLRDENSNLYQLDLLQPSQSATAPTSYLTGNNVRAYGARGDGATDDTAAFAAAIAATGTGWVYVPTGTYLITSQLIISALGTRIFGDGKSKSVIRFNPAVGAEVICFKFSAGASVLYRCGLEGIGFESSNSGAVRCMVELSDVSEFILRDVCSTAIYGVGSVGVRIKGRDTITVDRVQFTMDNGSALVIGRNPNAGPGVLDADHLSVNDFYPNCGTQVTYPCISVVDGALLGPINFTGQQAWVGGKGGFLWDDTSSTASSQPMHFENVRYERTGAAAGAYMIRVSHTGLQGSYSIKMTNCGGGNGADYNGYYFRKCVGTTFDSCYYGGSGVALDINGTCEPVTLINSPLLTGGGTFQANRNGTTGAILAHGIPSGAVLPQNCTLVSEGQAQAGVIEYDAMRWQWGKDGVTGLGTLQDNGTITVPWNGNARCGAIRLTSDEHACRAVYYWSKTAGAFVAGADCSANIANVSTAGKLSIEAGSSPIIRNRLGSAEHVHVIAEWSQNT